MYENRVAELIIYDSSNQIKNVLMCQNQVTIGRENSGSPCDVALSSELVSACHGVFSCYKGEYYYSDGINVNGTFINGVKIQKEPNKFSLPQKLRSGDILSIGVTSLSKEKTVYILFTTNTSTNHMWNACALNTFNQTLTIGRDRNMCDLIIHEPTVSKRHAIITKKDGRLYVTDCKSANGVILNGRGIKPNTPVPFNERDVLTIGRSKVFHLGNALVYNQSRSEAPTPLVNIPPVYNPDVPQQGGQSIHITNKPVYNPGDISRIVPDSGGYSHMGGVELKAEKISKIVPCKKGTGINGTGRKYILDDISLTIYPGELVAILGGSGAGKTTFMNAINGFEPPTSGNVYFNGNDLYKNYQSIKSQIGYVPQQDIVYDNLTMADMLTYVAKLRLPGDFSKDELSKRVDEVLSAMALEKQKYTLIKKLSGGQKKRASIAVELISDPAIFFLDEPTSGLDPEAETNLMKLLQKLSRQKGKTVIVITHTLQNIHLFNKVIFLAPGGKLCFYGTPDDAKQFFGVDNLADAYEKISEDIDMYVNRFKSQRQ